MMSNSRIKVGFKEVEDKPLFELSKYNLAELYMRADTIHDLTNGSQKTSSGSSTTKFSDFQNYQEVVHEKHTKVDSNGCHLLDISEIGEFNHMTQCLKQERKIGQSALNAQNSWGPQLKRSQFFNLDEDMLSESSDEISDDHEDEAIKVHMNLILEQSVYL